MTQTFSNIINPLLIKELRQFVRNRFIIALINIYVLAIVVACLLVFAESGMRSDGDVVGKDLFFALANIIFGVGVLAVVLRTVWSTSTEKVNEDLMFYSSMRPSTIVLGKVISGVLLTLILMSVTMPFVTLAYLSRGIDLTNIFAVLIWIFLVIQVLNCFAIFASALNRIKYSVFLSTMAVAGASFFTYMGSMSVVYHMIYTRVISWSWGEHIYVVLFNLLSLIALFICGATAMFSPPASNRMFPVRILFTSIFVIAIIAAFSGQLLWSVNDACEGIVAISLFVAPFVILMISCERDQWSTRIRKKLPKSFIYRAILFPFYTGAACGIFWFLVVMLVVTVMMIFVSLRHDIIDGGFQIDIFCGIVIFAFNYGVTAMLIRSRFFKKLDSSYVAIIVLILLLVFTLGSTLLYLSVMITMGESSVAMNNPLESYSQELISACNPFCDIGQSRFSTVRSIGMIIWFLVLIIPLTRWYSRQLKNFNPNIKESITYDEACQIVYNSENNKGNDSVAQA
ncbi:MAG: hypothetical protein LBL39_01440 [Planctomycetaceae bacterium]|jgi:hypothetical protein|nr:hypothetical protein [Planctomycetaceae bacterium]